MPNEQKQPGLIVTGMPHSGTTFLSNFIKTNVNTLNGGFECGVLLSAKTPRDFPDISPFFDWLCYPVKSGHWGLSPQQRAFAIDTDDWEVFYRRLASECPIMTSSQLVLDKTPAYSYHLERTLDRVPSCPVIVVDKSPLLLYKSYKKRGIPIEGFLKRIKQYQTALDLALEKHSSRITIITHSSLATDPLNCIRKISSKIGLKPQNQISFNLNWDSLPPLNRDYDYKTELDSISDYLTCEEIETIQRLT